MLKIIFFISIVLLTISLLFYGIVSLYVYKKKLQFMKCINEIDSQLKSDEND